MGKKILVAAAIVAVGAIIAVPIFSRLYTNLFFKLHRYQFAIEPPFYYGTRDFIKQASVFRYTWSLESKDPEELEITIPDYIGDYPVRQLGDGVNFPFFIDVKGRDFVPVTGVRLDENRSVAWYMKGDCELYYLDFTLNIGPTIEVIFPDPGIISGRSWGKKQIYCPRVYVNCDPDNLWYYSENGKLYDKKGKLVDFLYWDWVDPIAAPAA